MLHAAMKQPRSKTAIEGAAEHLRALVLSAPDGALLGSEDALISSLGVSRITFLQAVRLLEREGFIRVKRGINGGYFSARPNSATIERAVGAYLDTLDTDNNDIMMLASALWVEAVRKIASLNSPEFRALTEKMQKKLKNIKPDAQFNEISKFEIEHQANVFSLINSPYIELIYHINAAFAQRRFLPSNYKNDPEKQIQFVQAWRQAKLLEIVAIADGDAEIAALAARHTRNLVHKEIWNITHGGANCAGSGENPTA